MAERCAAELNSPHVFTFEVELNVLTLLSLCT
ncbi:unnamed protein product, partial [Linum tenue]